MRRLRRIVSTITGILKTSGINHRSRQTWAGRLAQYCTEWEGCPMAEHLIAVVEQYFDGHYPLLVGQDRLLCCSDIIETTFGHYKNKGRMKVISSDVLYLPLLAHRIDVHLVTTGLQTVHQRMVETWHQRHTCDNQYSIPRRLRDGPKTGAAVA